MQVLDVSFDLPDDIFLRRDAVFQRLRGGSGTLFCLPHFSVLFFQPTDTLAGYIMLLLKRLERAELFGQGLFAGRSVGGKFQLRLTGLHRRKPLLHLFQVARNAVDLLTLRLNLTGYERGCLLSFTQQLSHRLLAFAKGSGKVVLH